MPEFQLHTTRESLMKQYKDAGAPFDVSTMPLKSTLPFLFDLVDARPVAAPTVIHAVLRRNQKQEFFGYGVGDQIPSGPPGLFRRSTEADTNISRARRTIGASDMVIEGISAMRKTTRIVYPNGLVPGPIPAPNAIADPDVLQAYQGQLPFYDPATLSVPPQMGSPFNLEDALFEALKPQMQVEFEWDRKNVKKIGTLDEIPEGAAKSFLHASGDPRNDNRFRIPEGYWWSRDTMPGCDFITRLTVADPVVVPISLLTVLSGVTVAPTVIPSFIILDVTIRLHGMAFSFQGRNG